MTAPDYITKTFVAAGEPLRHDIERWGLPLASLNLKTASEDPYVYATRVLRSLVQPGSAWPRERWEAATEIVRSMADGAGELAQLTGPIYDDLREMRLLQQRHLIDLADRLAAVTRVADPTAGLDEEETS